MYPTTLTLLVHKLGILITTGILINIYNIIINKSYFVTSVA